jgi:hypothetical protein
MKKESPPAWVIQNTQRGLVLIRSYQADMQAKGILSAAQGADGVARDFEDRLAGRKPFPDYRPELANPEWSELGRMLKCRGTVPPPD